MLNKARETPARAMPERIWTRVRRGKSEEVGLRKSGKGPGNDTENKKNPAHLHH